MRLAARTGNCFAAGALGGLANALVVWAFGHFGVSALLGVAIAPALSKAMIYQRVVWGGLWGVLFLLPMLRGSVFWRGLIMSLGPSLVTLFWLFPSAGKGLAGQNLGFLTPALVLLFNAVWGWVAAVWLAAGRE